jgi:hypothetical protein
MVLDSNNLFESRAFVRSRASIRLEGGEFVRKLW